MRSWTSLTLAEVQLFSEAALGAFPSPGLARSVRSHVAARSRWLQRYLLSGDEKTIFDNEWRATVPANVPASTVDAFLSAIKPVTPRWRTLRIPVEIPLRRLLTSVRLTPTSPTSSVYEGRALAFDLELATSYAWLGEAEKRVFKVTYDITANAEDWVVVGKKRGIYVADVSEVSCELLTTARPSRNPAGRSSPSTARVFGPPSCVSATRRRRPDATIRRVRDVRHQRSPRHQGPPIPHWHGRTGPSLA